MADINEPIGEDVVEIQGDPSEIKEQPGRRRRLPQPRRYSWQLPQNLDQAWSERAATINGKLAKRLGLSFKQDYPLTIVEDLAGGGEFVGETPFVSISDREFKRGPRDGNGPTVSDMFYFMRDGLGMTILQKEKNSDKRQRVNEHAGDIFSAEVELRARCDDKRDIYMEGKKIEGVKGCGATYYQNDLLRDEHGYFLSRLDCGGTRISALGQEEDCGANLLVNVQLVRFKPHKAEEKAEAS